MFWEKVQQQSQRIISLGSVFIFNTQNMLTIVHA